MHVTVGRYEGVGAARSDEPGREAALPNPPRIISGAVVAQSC